MELLNHLYDIGVFKFGEFKLKNGAISPIYIDFRITISYPMVLKELAKYIYSAIMTSNPKKDLVICGVPYTGIPIATTLSTLYDIPMIIRRKEKKDYGTKQMIEGKYTESCQCILIDDVITTGASIQETIDDLNKVGIKDIIPIVLVDRQLETKSDNKITSLWNIREVVNTLHNVKKIDDTIYNNIQKYFAKFHKHALYDRLKKIIKTKKSRLCVALDVTDPDRLLDLADKLGPIVCAIKTHFDILASCDDDLLETLKMLSVKHNFIIIEDRKLADIGNTMKLQLDRLSPYIDTVTVHGFMGYESIKMFKDINYPIIMIADMSVNTFYADHTESIVKIAEELEVVIGVVSQAVKIDNVFTFTPGVHLHEKSDGINQNYINPNEVDNSNIIIVGRGIINADDPVKEALKYKEMLQVD